MAKARLRGRLASLAVVWLLIGTAGAMAFSESDIIRLQQARECFRCDLRGIDLSQQSWIRTNLMESTMSGAKMAGINLEDSNLDLVKMKGADLTGARLRFSIMGRADLRGVSLRGADLVGALLKYSDLRDADLSGANLSAANLAQSNLTGARLTGANMFNVKMQGANLSGADLTGTLGLKQSQLNQSCGSLGTRLPEGLWVALCDRAREQEEDRLRQQAAGQARPRR
ncbi:MAG: pentapeptide repeat-containing protein [Alphaproteobacteria bacterium]|nr:pentapeptide repeat-containing protein [Alphaproteobacteria bacterium]